MILNVTGVSMQTDHAAHVLMYGLIHERNDLFGQLTV